MGISVSKVNCFICCLCMGCVVVVLFFFLQMCTLNKGRNDTWVRVSWNGNMRITRCTSCCMRWYFTINGEECADPGKLTNPSALVKCWMGGVK